MSEVIFHTIPSVWMAPGEAPATRPYRRVVGIETAAGLIACRFAVLGKPERIRLAVPDALAVPVAEFFDEHIADDDPELPSSPEQLAHAMGHRSAGPMRYNCHVFALAAVHGATGLKPHQLDGRMYQINRNARPFTGNLPVGRYGLVRNSDLEDMSHSFVGLGEEVPFCLQVVNTNSNMGLMPYDQLLGEYSRYRGGQYELAA